jgi:hypothetical protein
MDITYSYDQPTALITRPDRTLLALAASRRKQAVRFQGIVRDPLRLRQALLAFHSVLALNARGQRGEWLDDDTWRQTPDPIVSVQPDQIAFEAFSNDGSGYARLTAPLAAFEMQGDFQTGTTSVDFSWNLRDALLRLRSSRPTVLSIGATGLDVGALPSDAFARQVSVPEKWVKGFLQVQGALTMRPFSFNVKPVDLLTIITYLDEHRPYGPPQGLRYIFTPGEPIKVALEPWEETITLRGTHYTGYQRTVRVWGRKRLDLLRDALPYADRVAVAVLGRGLPHIYTCQCGPYQLQVALSGWAANDWALGSAFDLLVAQRGDNADDAARVLLYLSEHVAARSADIAANTGLPQPDVEAALFTLARAGRVMYDLVGGVYRLRELFAEPIKVEDLFTVDPRVAQAQKLVDDGAVTLGATQRGGERSETRVSAVVHDGDEEYAVSVSLDDSGRLRFGRCECAFFQANLMAKGPCAHILASRLAFDAQDHVAAPSRSRVGVAVGDDDDDDDFEEEDEEDIPF